MSALKQLSAVYLLAASAFTVAILMAHYPEFARDSRMAAREAGRTGGALVAGIEQDVLAPAYGVVRAKGAQAWQALAQAYAPRPVSPARTAPRVAPRSPRIEPVPAGSVIIKVSPLRPRLAEIQLRTVEPHPATTSMTATKPEVAPPPVSTASLPPADHPPSAAELVRIEQRLKDNLTKEMLANFELFLYVSKADKGPWAQRMYVFAKEPSGNLALLHDWPVSTGRERIEVSASGQRMDTDTPQGYYELDPHRIYRHYSSHQWHQPMPYAMFFNWVHDGLETGLAIHAAPGKDISLLGRRASAGCIHLAPQQAATLFNLIRTKYKGRVPRFTFDRRTHTLSNDGLFLHDAHGKLRYAEGYRVLVFIENYGGENVVAMLM